jgi:uncharacterized membrane protein
MNTTLWAKMHGGTTHFPIALIMASVIFDFLAQLVRNEEYQRDLRGAAYWSLLLAALGACGAVLTGLLLTNWDTMGAGLLYKHHIFVWPAFGLVVGLAVWRIVVRKGASKTAYGIYLAVMLVATVLMSAAGYWGGEILLGAN